MNVIDNHNLMITSGCLCPGNNVIYECRVASGGAATVWKIDDCEIRLRHSEYRSGGQNINRCKSKARSLRIAEDGSYISQLNITVTDEIVGKRITCFNYVDSDTDLVIVGTKLVAGKLRTC